MVNLDVFRFLTVKITVRDSILPTVLWSLEEYRKQMKRTLEIRKIIIRMFSMRVRLLVFLVQLKVETNIIRILWSNIKSFGSINGSTIPIGKNYFPTIKTFERVSKNTQHIFSLGFGYELSDGKIGVLLHANSYIVLQRDGVTVDDWSQTNNRQARFAIGEAPRSAQRHLKILQYFVDYISQKLCDGAVNPYSLSAEGAMHTPHVRLTKWKSYDQVCLSAKS